MRHRVSVTRLSLGIGALVAFAGVAGFVGLVSTRGWLAAGARADAQRGQQLFAQTFTPAEGLGPLYNNTSCLACHNTPAPGGTGPAGLATVLRVGRFTSTGFDPMTGHGGPVARAHSVAELGLECDLSAGVPMGANVTSVRNAPQLFGDGAIDNIPDAVILAGALPRADGIHGRPNLVNDRVGRFGWKADTAQLEQFVGEAFRNELGITTAQAPIDLAPRSGTCNGDAGAPEADASIVDSVTAYVAALSAPASQPGDRAVFDRIGCNECHVPQLGGVPLYSDLLLHDMGGTLDDGVVQGQATGHDWRTAPLWGVSQRTRFLHDGRAHTLEAAILAHGGEAAAVIDRFRGLSEADGASLLAFLATL